PVELQNPHVGVLVAVDETPRRDTSAEALAALKPAFVPDGKVTAGNSSQICDGAAAVLIASEQATTRLGLEPRARFVSFGLAGVDPHRMLHGNPQACERALARAGLAWNDMSVIEVNEAFACVVLQFARDAGLEERWDDINPNGGGISLGHPLGATGARITATLLQELDRRNARYGTATMCIGCGRGVPATRELARRHRVTGVDISAVQVELARHHVPEASFVHGDAMELEVAPASFDAVVALFVFGHVPIEEQAGLIARIGLWL